MSIQKVIETKERWSKAAAEHLVGKTIKEVRYMTLVEAHDMDWHSAPLIIVFTDGSWIYPSADDEGNDGGALFTSFENLPVIPVT